ncbi:PREDICTED: probable disease resistance RPP8-like protein 2 [Theobroma cacao]|uniref:Probable disease resistance RPP8-like protein 2 n=1 Tax=Theobroma cacao TaxID=3641 RepID=A0AB32W0F7_THECC|nr:PREDICTED: probable disease resistance RPP8-like protein 2 [Theobroma cacao]
MAEAVVSNVAARLGELVTQEAKFLWGVEDQVKRLQTELVWMKSFLKEADSRQAEDERVRLWVTEIRDIAYDAEDVIETFALKIASKRRGGISNVIKRSACIFKEGWMLHKVRSDIEGIISRTTDLVRRLQSYGIKELSDGASSSSSSKRQQLRQSYPHMKEPNAVGLDNDIKELVSVLVDEGRHFRVASICGMGGLGKTTLAKKVYHHAQVRNHFKHFVWAYISQQCQRRTVWKGILSSLGLIDEKGGILLDMGDQDLAAKLYEFLKENKCLVVLDDIWTTEDWDAISPAFPMEEETGSKILLTSRNQDVARHADPRGCLHELQCLTNDEGWKLFQHICDSAGYVIEEKMEELGKDMVKQCAGLPLAIVVLGGILVTKHSLNSWQIVHENVKSYLRKGRSWGIYEAIALSYDNLPSYLKQCFLYLSVFPEDYKIPVGKLIKLWVAEDIVSLAESEENREEVMEDVAEGYLNELVERYMVLMGERDVSSKIKTCWMHDLIRDFCLLKAKQENFIYVLDHLQMEQADVSFLSPTIGKVRRLGINDSFLIYKIKNPHLRTALFFDQNIVMEILNRSPVLKWFRGRDFKHSDAFLMLYVYYKVIHKPRGLRRYICNNFKLLRILEFGDQDILFFGILLSDIGSLVHLRFLSFGNCLFVAMLPSFISKLRCLQTLDLRNCVGVYVPNVLWKLEGLRHLYLPKVIVCSKTKLKLDTLKNLQTLVNFNTENCYLENIYCMKYLRELRIITPFIVENFKEDLNLNPPIITSKHLRSLSIIKNDDDHESIDPRHLTYLFSGSLNICELHLSAKIRKLPEPQHIPSNIAHIYLGWARLDEDPLPTLQNLPNLRILELEENAFVGKVMICSAQGFPLLNALSIISQSNLEELRVSEGAMPNLHHLRIVNCRMLKMLPFISTLKELKIEKMPKAFKDKLVEGGEDSYKVQHVPSIIFQNCDD